MSSSEAYVAPTSSTVQTRTDVGAHPRRDAGFVTAEAAVALPVLVLFTMGLLWALFAVAAQIQCVDAARAGARAAARQDPYDAAVAAARQAAPKGAEITIRREGDLVRVSVAADTPGPAALALRLHQEAVAMAEDTLGGGGPKGLPPADASGSDRAPDTGLPGRPPGAEGSGRDVGPEPPAEGTAQQRASS